MLAALLLALDHGSGGQMAQPHRGLGLVGVLSTGTRGAEDLHLALVQEILVGFGQLPGHAMASRKATRTAPAGPRIEQ